MAVGSVLAGILLVTMAVSWYGLQVAALRDLVRRPRVRGDNKLLWAFAILCIPYAGALSYLTIGPIGFMPRPVRSSLGRTSRIVTLPGHRPVQPYVASRRSPPTDCRPASSHRDDAAGDASADHGSERESACAGPRPSRHRAVAATGA